MNLQLKLSFNNFLFLILKWVYFIYFLKNILSVGA